MTITDAICSLQGIRTYFATKSCEAIAEGNELATLGFKESIKEVGEIISLLKEQDAVKPKKADNPDESEYCCGICGYPLWLDEFYCAHCGRRIKWEGQ